MTPADEAREGGETDGPAFTDGEIQALFRRLARYPRLALAASGGADSTALMILIRRWLDVSPTPAPQMTVLTVDHRLRDEARAEASWVSALAAQLGFAHRTLAWEGEKPKTGVQAAARAARYDLLTGFCKERGIPAIVTAHNRDDQAETFVMRLARGSGVDGLSAMAAHSDMRGIDLLRPLLDVSRARLVRFLTDQSQSWLEDPSNRDERYERVRIREALRAAEALGLSREALALTARRLGRARDALETVTSDVLKSSLIVHEAGFGEMSYSALFDLAEEIGLRVLCRLCLAFGGVERPPRLARLEAAYGALREAPASLTLGGCQFVLRRSRLVVAREFGRLGRAETLLSPGQIAMWDHRFALRVPIAVAAPEPLALRPLGVDGLKAIKSANGTHAPVPRAAALALPSLWLQGRLVYAPFIAFAAGPPVGWIAQASAEFIGRAALFTSRADCRA
jgi:tRNA(Ile)-lysidine synthase